MSNLLKESDVIAAMSEEWNARVTRLLESVDIKDVDVLSPELKVLHKNSRIRYTIDSVGPRDIILRTPEGKTFVVDNETIEKEYEIS